MFAEQQPRTWQDNDPHHIADWVGTKVLITGGLGFIGSNLAIRLADLKADVTVVDSLIPSYGGNRCNLQGYDDRIKLNFSDIRDADELITLMEDVEILFSLAGQTSHLDSMYYPQLDLAHNCSGQLNVLEACRARIPKVRVVYASTRQIYGRPKYLPVDENHPIAPVDINGIHKYAAEEYYRLYGEIYDIETCSLRLTNTIGPRMRIKDARQTFVGVWIRQLLEGVPIEVWGGQQLRDFNDVDDVVDAMLIAAKHPELTSGSYNLGSPEVISLQQLAELMININGSGEYRVMEYPAERKKIDIGDYYSSFRHFSQKSGWHPSRSLEETLRRTIEFYRMYYHSYI